MVHHVAGMRYRTAGKARHLLVLVRERVGVQLSVVRVTGPHYRGASAMFDGNQGFAGQSGSSAAHRCRRPGLPVLR